MGELMPKPPRREGGWCWSGMQGWSIPVILCSERATLKRNSHESWAWQEIVLEKGTETQALLWPALPLTARESGQIPPQFPCLLNNFTQ